MDEVIIKGVQKTSLIDYPEKICSVVFLSRCNFRCPFCHNPELVFDEKHVPDIPVSEFMEFLDEHKKWIDGVCITGGEPTLHDGLIDFMKQIKSKGLLVKLDTNGTNPQIIEKAISEKCVDYVAMDIKNSPEKYAETVRAKVNIENINKSISIMIDSGDNNLIDYEFRSTILPKIHSEQEIEGMAELIKGAKNFTIQQFHKQDRLVDDKFQDEQTYLLKDLENFKNKFSKHIHNISIRE
ncbi:MAG: anaerobic ribonucleoside-triphosphate reductase activating protein [Candidatus Woesearchaeota archaeon]